MVSFASPPVRLMTAVALMTALAAVARLAVAAPIGALGGACVRAGAKRLCAAQQRRHEHQKTETFGR
jgi:hypothetical protein